jgi:hypothetical protein
MAGAEPTLKSYTVAHNFIMTYRVKFFGPLAPQIIAAKGNKVRTALFENWIVLGGGR